METISQLKNGDVFRFDSVNYLVHRGIDPDQQPFTVTSTTSPVSGYIYVKDRNGIPYLLGPDHVAVNRSK